MTVSYVNQVATTKFWKFLKLLLLWKGSVYKMVWFELVLFGVLYASLSTFYRCFLWGTYKYQFEQFCIYCSRVGNFMPIAFILSFYVAMIANRWWDQFKSIPWPDNVALCVSTYIAGSDEKTLMLKRNIVRYMNISLLLFLRSVSPQIKKKFPEEISLVHSRLLNEKEYELFQEVDGSYNRYYVPLMWATTLAKSAFSHGAIKTEGRLNNIVMEIVAFRERLNRLFAYDWVNPPLVYTQTATIAVYTFFLTSLFSNQFLDPTRGYDDHEIDFIVPVFSIFQLVFYFGWLKVAEALINPFGEDDDDFDCLGLVERNLTASLMFVDPSTLFGVAEDAHPEAGIIPAHPPLCKDPKWNRDHNIDFSQSGLGGKSDSMFFMGSLGNIR